MLDTLPAIGSRRLCIVKPLNRVPNSQSLSLYNDSGVDGVNRSDFQSLLQKKRMPDELCSTENKSPSHQPYLGKPNAKFSARALHR